MFNKSLAFTAVLVVVLVCSSPVLMGIESIGEPASTAVLELDQEPALDSAAVCEEPSLALFPSEEDLTASFACVYTCDECHAACHPLHEACHTFCDIAVCPNCP